MIYTVTFNPAIDYVVRMEKLEIGSVNRSREEALFYGGKGINVSTVLKNLGVDSVALGFVAGFTGKAIEEGVAALGVKADFITVSDGVSRINVKLKAGEETEINGKGPNISDAELEELYKKLDGLTDGDCLVLAGAIPPSLPSDVYEKIMARLAGKKVTLLFNIFMIHWQTAVTATTITKRIASVFNAPKSTAPFPTILSTICPVMIGAYKVRTTDIAAQIRERTTKKLYRLIYFNILPSVFLLTDVLFPFLLIVASSFLCHCISGRSLFTGYFICR